MTKEVDFVGFTDVQHVADERPFAGIICAVSGLSADAIHETMVKAGLSSKNGSTDPRHIGRMKLQGHGGNGSVLIEPLGLNGGTGPEEILEQIDEEFVAGRAVAVAHRLNSNPRSRKRHWTLFTGYYKHDDGKGVIHAIDPSRNHANYFSSHIVRNIIERSVDAAGVHVYTLTPKPAKPKLAVIYAFDQEPELIENTYTATGQDKVGWSKPSSVA
jgi:hypothetical protein